MTLQLSISLNGEQRQWPLETAPVRIGHLNQVDTFITDRCDIAAVKRVCRDAEVELIETAITGK